jgi:murein DD-endopeptidase MepM/ murein hydrolase activator NlpD
VSVLPLLAAALLLQQPSQAPLIEVQWRPAVPLQGSLILVHAPGAFAGALAGEPLHFEEGNAMAAVPLGAGDSVTLEIFTLRNRVLDARRVTIPVAERAPSRERIQVASRFSRPPDKALQARIDRERALSRDAAERGHRVPRLWTEPFLRPRDSRVTSPFGGGRLVNGVVRSRHYGLDLDGRTGDPVKAANRGVVALVGDFFYGGRSVFIHHGAGLMTVYHHLSRRLVAVGDTVSRGQVIGLVGATGRVTGPHLHWAAQYGGIAFDPTDLLTLFSAAPAASPD